MDAGDAIAVYAAIVATGGLAWNIYSWRAARVSRVEVLVQFAFLPEPGVDVHEGVVITAINRGDRPVRVDGAGLDLQDGSGRTLAVMQPPHGATLPGVVEPGQSGMTYLLRPPVEQSGIDLTRPLAGWVRLATGELLRSKRRALISD